MRIAIDFQGAQTGSRFRGIGRYSTELVKAMIREGTQHEFILVLNGAFSESLEPIRAEFEQLLSKRQIAVWYPAGEPEGFDHSDGPMREVSQIIREHFLACLEPDLILIPSLFEGLGNPAVFTVKEYLKGIPTCAVFHDFIPLMMPDEHFRWNPLHRFWYRQRIEQLENCDLILTNSESSRSELRSLIDFPEEKSKNIFGAADRRFVTRAYSNVERSRKLAALGIRNSFILCAGGMEENKNLRRLVESLALLPAEIKAKYELVVVGRRGPGEKERILGFATDGASREMLNVFGYVSDNDLVDLYNLCDVFVFPSLHEGFGLPAIEAMACGAPTIVSNLTSLPEVVANPAAEFDPTSIRAIADKIVKVLTDPAFRESLRASGLQRARELSWENTARTALDEIERKIAPIPVYDDSAKTVVMHTGKFEEQPLRILVTKLDHNGDFVLGLPGMLKLRSRYPHARIDIVVGSWNVPAAELTGLFDNIYVLDYFKSKSSDKPILDELLFKELVAGLPVYHFALDLRRQPDTRFLLIRFPAYEYFGYDCGDHGIDRLLNKSLPHFSEPFARRSYFDSSHETEQILKIIDLLPFAATDYLTPKPLVERQPVEPGSVAIFPRSGNEARQWDTDRFAALIDDLVNDDRVSTVNLYGGRLEELNSIPFQPSAKIAFHAGLRFPDLVASLSANVVCVGNNSFGVHLGSYAGCKTLGIYSGHELPQQWGPGFGDAIAITADAPCSPCHLPDRQSCPYDTFCLSDISVQAVERLVFEILDGHEVRETYAKISRFNPASAIQPLIHQVINSKHLGRFSGLTEGQKTAIAAAISVNFPERLTPGRIIYIDVSGLLTKDQGMPAWTRARLERLEHLAEMLSEAGSWPGGVVFIATKQHDHEFYAIEPSDLWNLDRVLSSSLRNNQVVRPLAGDFYFSPDVHLGRNGAIWNLLMAWREGGVTVVMQAPEAAALTVEDEETRDLAAAYLYRIAHFDAVTAHMNEWAELEGWLDEFGPPRLRPLGFLEGRSRRTGLLRPSFAAALLNGGMDAWMPGHGRAAPVRDMAQA